MPAAVPIVIAGIAAASAPVAISLAAGAAIAWTSVAITAAVAMAFTAASMALNGTLSGSSQPESPSFTSEAKARTQMIRASTEPRRIVYGEALCSGVLVYAASTGNKNEYLHLVITLAAHQVQSIGAIYFNDELVGDLDAGGNVTTGRFAGKVRIKKHLGSVDQVPDADLAAEVPEWATKYRPLRGIAYMYLRLQYDRDVFPTGIPNPKAVVKGKADIWDFRTNTYGWSDNPGLCTLDYILWKNGMKCALEEVRLDTWIAAANACDELVNITGGTQKRYTLNGTFTLDQNPGDLLNRLRSAMAGAAIYSMGQWSGYAGVADVAQGSLNEDDLRGPLKFRTNHARSEIYNAVRGTYVNPADYWQATDFPVVTSPYYEAQDGNERIYKDVELPFTTDSVMAQRLAKVELETHRQQTTVQFPAKMSAIRFVPWRPIKLSIAQLGWVDKWFRIMSWKLSEDGGVDLELREYSAAAYDWNMGMATTTDPAPNTSLTKPWDVPAPGAPTVSESLYVTRDGAGVKVQVDLVWTASQSAFVDRYEIRYKLSSDDVWTDAGRTRDAQVSLLDFAPGVFDFAVRSVSMLGVASPWAQIRKSISGLSAPPEALANVSIQAVSALAVLGWSQSADIDVRIGGHIEIRHVGPTGIVAWANSVSIGEALPGAATVAVLPLIPGSYLIRAFDSMNNGGPVSVVATSAATVQAFTTLSQVIEDPVFAGTHSDTFVDNGTLSLTGQFKVDSWGAIDTIQNVDIGPGGVDQGGVYAFASGIDAGSVKRQRLTRLVELTTYAALDSVDSRAVPIDTWLDIDGAGMATADCVVEVRTTSDDPASGLSTWSSWTPFVVTEINARAAQFRAQISISDPAYDVRISKLRVTSETL